MIECIEIITGNPRAKQLPAICRYFSMSNSLMAGLKVNRPVKMQNAEFIHMRRPQPASRFRSLQYGFPIPPTPDAYRGSPGTPAHRPRPVASEQRGKILPCLPDQFALLVASQKPRLRLLRIAVLIPNPRHPPEDVRRLCFPKHPQQLAPARHLPPARSPPPPDRSAWFRAMPDKTRLARSPLDTLPAAPAVTNFPAIPSPAEEFDLLEIRPSRIFLKSRFAVQTFNTMHGGRPVESSMPPQHRRHRRHIAGRFQAVEIVSTLAQSDPARPQPVITFAVANSHSSPIVALQNHQRPRER